MSFAVLLSLGLAGGLGAVARFAVGGAVARRAGAAALGTLAVNLTGAFVLGVLAGIALGAHVERIAATGFLGAYTTFSTWMLDTHRLAGNGRRGLALSNLAGSLVLGVVAVWLGRELATAV